MKSILLLIAFTCIGFSGGWLGRGYCHFPGPHGPGGDNFCSAFFRPKGPLPPPLDRLLADLNVDAGQREQIIAIDDKHKPQMEALRQVVEDKRQAFENAMLADKAQADLMPYYLDLVSARQNSELEMYSMMMEVRDLLSPEQRKNLRMPMLRRGPPGPGGHHPRGFPPPSNEPPTDRKTGGPGIDP